MYGSEGKEPGGKWEGGWAGVGRIRLSRPHAWRTANAPAFGQAWDLPFPSLSLSLPQTSDGVT